MTYLNADVFGADAISKDVITFNERIAAMTASLPGLWDMDLAEARKGLMPSPPPSPQSYDLIIPGDLSLHVVPAPESKGLLLHLHGGGFILGGAAKQDPMLERVVAATGMTCVSLEYRLAPEHPYPSAWDDCEAAAVWLADNAQTTFGVESLVIMGESAGALLAVATLVRLRDRGLPSLFRGAALSCGVYDSNMTPSQRNARTGVLKARDIERIVDAYAAGADRRTPDLSPLYSDLRDLPPALFTVGTLDAMLDDSLFMHSRWLAAGNQSALALYPGADHAFIETPHPLAGPANARIDAFLGQCLSR